MQDDPLVMPGHDLAGILENPVGRRILVCRLLGQRIGDGIMEGQQRDLHLRNQHVHVLARIADQGGAFLIARQVVVPAAVVTAQQQLRRIAPAVQVRLGDRTVAVQAFQVQTRAADVAQQGLVVVVGHRGPVGGDVVRHVLPEHRPSGGDRARLAAPAGGAVTGTTGATQRMHQSGVDTQRRQVGKQPGVASAARWCVHGPAGREAVVACRPARRAVHVSGTR